MDKPKKTAVQINPDVEVDGKYQEALESPLHNLSSKEEVVKNVKSEEE